MRVLGVKVTTITPSRGFTMETCTALVTAVGSFFVRPEGEAEPACMRGCTDMLG
jgi:hypothetical protein